MCHKQRINLFKNQTTEGFPVIIYEMHSQNDAWIQYLTLGIYEGLNWHAKPRRISNMTEVDCAIVNTRTTLSFSIWQSNNAKFILIPSPLSRSAL